jgi:hypothetical protein
LEPLINAELRKWTASKCLEGNFRCVVDLTFEESFIAEESPFLREEFDESRGEKLL